MARNLRKCVQIVTMALKYSLALISLYQAFQTWHTLPMQFFYFYLTDRIKQFLKLMTYNPQREQNMNLTGTGVHGNVNLYPSQAPPHITMANSIRQAEPQQFTYNPQNYTGGQLPGMMTNTTGYNKFVDDQIYGQVQEAANPLPDDEKPIQTKDIASTIGYLVIGFILVVSRGGLVKEHCPVLLGWSLFVAVYFILIAFAKGAALYILKADDAGDSQFLFSEQTKKDYVRFVLRVGRFGEVIVLFGLTIALSVADSSPCDVACGHLQTAVSFFLFLSWGLIIGLSAYYGIHMKKRFEAVSQQNSQMQQP